MTRTIRKAVDRELELQERRIERKMQAKNEQK